MFLSYALKHFFFFSLFHLFDRQSDRTLQSTDSLSPECLQELELGQAKARNPKLHESLLQEWQGPITG